MQQVHLDDHEGQNYFGSFAQPKNLARQNDFISFQYNQYLKLFYEKKLTCCTYGQSGP